MKTEETTRTIRKFRFTEKELREKLGIKGHLNWADCDETQEIDCFGDKSVLKEGVLYIETWDERGHKLREIDKEEDDV